MENVIISQNKHWKNSYKGLYKRDIFDDLVKKLELKHIQVLQLVETPLTTIFSQHM